jgi:hypothetical protein
MIDARLSLLAVSLLALGVSGVPARAQLSRTFVSAASGNDINNCDRPTPCRTFQGAHNKTNADGEITVLDTGGYGAVTITKSISIVSEVGEASILVSGGATGITINAGAAGYVNLRGITIQGIGFGGGKGLTFSSGFSLTMTNCVIRNHTSNGLEFFPTGSSTLDVSNTLVADNGGFGIAAFPFGSGNVKLAFSHVETYNNSGDGIGVSNASATGGTINAVIADSVANGNGGFGYVLGAFSGHPPANLTVTRSVVANNATGLLANGPLGTLRIGQSTVMGNTTSWEVMNGGFLRSYGDNNIDGNGDGDPAPITIGKK